MKSWHPSAFPQPQKGRRTRSAGHCTSPATGLPSRPIRPQASRSSYVISTSDKSMRDQRVQQALETSRYPTATFTITSVSGYNPAVAEGQEQTLELSGNLELHGVTKPATWEVKAYRQGNVISALATVTVKFSDFNITPPTFQGLLSISDQATLQVQLIAQAA